MEFKKFDTLSTIKLINNHFLQAQCLIHIGGDAVKVAYVPLQLLSIPSSFTMVAAKA